MGGKVNTLVALVSYPNVSELVPAPTPGLRAGAASPVCARMLTQDHVFAYSPRRGTFCCSSYPSCLAHALQ